MLVKVTQAHIDRGRPCTMGACPIALAIQDAYGIGLGGTFVNGNEIYVKGSYWPTPDPAKRFIRRFDRNRADVKPFSFSLPIDA